MNCVLFFFLEKKEPKIQEQTIPSHKQHPIAFVPGQRSVPQV